MSNEKRGTKGEDGSFAKLRGYTAKDWAMSIAGMTFFFAMVILIMANFDSGRPKCYDCDPYEWDRRLRPTD